MKPPTRDYLTLLLKQCTSKTESINSPAKLNLCLIAGCIAPSSPTNGEFKVLGDLNVLGNPGPMTSVSFKCASGYYLGGPRVITCQYDGSYNGTTPECFKGYLDKKIFWEIQSLKTLLDESEEFWWWPFILGFLLFVCGFFNIFAFLWRRIEKLSTKKDNASKK